MAAENGSTKHVRLDGPKYEELMIDLAAACASVDLLTHLYCEGDPTALRENTLEVLMLRLDAQMKGIHEALDKGATYER